MLCLPANSLERLHRLAMELGLQVLVETFDEADIDQALATDVFLTPGTLPRSMLAICLWTS